MYVQLKDDPHIVIAKGDATANDFPPLFEVRGCVVASFRVCMTQSNGAPLRLQVPHDLLGAGWQQVKA